MPKQKTHSGAKKRFKVTGSGKIMRPKGGKAHHMEVKSQRQVRRMTGMTEVAKNDVPRIKKLLGR